jgi:hypothetical protein
MQIGIGTLDVFYLTLGIIGLLDFVYHPLVYHPEGEGGSVVVKSLCYKPEGRGFETQWG